MTPSTSLQPGGQLLTSAKETAQRVIATVERKNGDYATSDDPFKNFRSSELLGLSIEKAILVRTLDKIVRIDNLASHDAFVADESMEDSIDDVIGYMLLLRAYRDSQCPPAFAAVTAKSGDASGN